MAEILHADLEPTRAQLVESWIAHQRWYAAKGSQPRLRLVDSWRLDDPEGRSGVETLIVADGSGSTPVHYQVPVTYRDAPLEGHEDHLIGTTEHSVLGTRWVYDGVHDPAYTGALMLFVTGAAEAQSGSVSDTPDPRVTSSQVRPMRPVVRSARVLSGEQSNTSIIYDATDEDGSPAPVIIKVFRMLADGENPDVVLQSALVRAGSDRVPAVLGSIAGEWTTGDARTAYGHFAFAQEFLPGVEDAWRVALRAAEDGEDFTEPARELGAATAEVHATLAEALGTSETTPEVARDLVSGMRARYAAAAAEAPALHQHEDAVMALLDASLDANWPALQRIHGDYHLGQVLRSPERGWILLDFEGEPLRPLSERTEPDQWLRDIAGMLRSFDYAGGAVEHAGSGSARDWVTAAQQAFLDGYTATKGDDPRDHGTLLDAFELDKAMYEVVYEVRNRPSWVDIPLAAVERLAARTHDGATGTPARTRHTDKTEEDPT
ncbi:putative trehalose synthase [Knoellia remsis]|uniref:Maltokinase n=1 Tax=Knoellia remsis TaxID=407159 RepID=A0A2T0UY54_9MICO|nr:phosphotransferase [Knoellia remsis]PRY62863.1 putative trehalose synthase [Knoellia remsis]